ncbi:MAG: imidazole glycerol-phosphate synthase subunit HisH [Solirubrobacteraceae bacterium]|nr:imidazole glycerol-phosphate synthase subunit HisH [Solirubrobacteraceae bacterium]
MTVAVVDYGMGNRRSVEKALTHVGAEAVITRDHELLRAAERIVVPGVGAFPAAMERLDALGLSELIRERARAGTPVLGICLGMQLLFDSSWEHGGAPGLGLLPGEVTYLDTRGERLPHIGWNLVRMRRPARLTAGLGDSAFYHVHSLVVRPADPEIVVGTAAHGETFVSIVERDNVFGAQFHPEKSSRDGLALLANFVRA